MALSSLKKAWRPLIGSKYKNMHFSNAKIDQHMSSIMQKVISLLCQILTDGCDILFSVPVSSYGHIETIS